MSGLRAFSACGVVRDLTPRHCIQAKQPGSAGTHEVARPVFVAVTAYCHATADRSFAAETTDGERLRRTSPDAVEHKIGELGHYLVASRAHPAVVPNFAVTFGRRYTKPIFEQGHGENHPGQSTIAQQ